MTVKINLISPYKGYKMLTNRGKVEFVNGVASMEFASQQEADQFVKSIEANLALRPYVKVVSQKAADDAAKLQQAAQSTKVVAGAQTSEMKNPQSKEPVSPANLLTTLGVK